MAPPPVAATYWAFPTTIDGLVLVVLLPSVRLLAVSTAPASVAVMVRVPVVLNVKLDKLRVPETRLRLPAVPPLSSAMLALLSELLKLTLGAALFTRFQLASTALTAIPLTIALP